MLSAFRVSLHDTSLHLPVVSQHPAELGLLDGIAVDALPDEPLMGASPAAVLVIETGELLVRRTDDDLVARLKRYGTQGYAGAAGQGSLRGVKVFPCFSL